jgi:hypothetical protein
VTFLPALAGSLAGWNELQSIGRVSPPFRLIALKTYGDQAWQRKVRDSLKHHFGSLTSARKPLFTSGTIISSDALVKDTNDHPKLATDDAGRFGS